MKHVHRLWIAGIFLSTICQAQDLNKSFIEISAGVGLPVGVFASKANNIKSGLAMNGHTINFEYNHYFKPKLGFCFGLKRSVFPLDLDAWTNSNPDATSDPWRILLIYGGFATRKRVGQKTIISPKLAIGLATSKYPDITIVTYNNSGPVVTHFRSNKGKAPAFLVGTTFKHILLKRIHVALNVDYLSTSPKFIVRRETVSNGQSSSIDNLHYTQNMQAVMAGLSLCYNFIPKS
jgi:hypothetical protein